MNADLSKKIVKPRPLVVALVFTGVIALLVAVSLQLYGEVGERQNTLASKAGGGPKIEWSIQHLQLTPALGEAETVEVSFQAKKDLGLVEPWIAPELRPYITIAPSEPQSVQKDEIVTLTLTVLVPSDDPHATLEGTIHIRQAIQPPKSLAKPLPVLLDMTSEWTTVSVSNISFLYPPILTQEGVSLVAERTSQSDNTRLVFIDIDEPGPENELLVLFVEPESTSPSTSLEDWLVRLQGDGSLLNIYGSESSADGNQLLFVSSPIPPGWLDDPAHHPLAEVYGYQAESGPGFALSRGQDRATLPPSIEARLDSLIQQIAKTVRVN